MTLVERIQRSAARGLMSLPEPALERLTKKRKEYRGALLDRRIQLALGLSKIAGRPTLDVLDPVRARLEQRVLQGLFDVERQEGVGAFDRRVAGVPVRVYKPAGAGAKLPVFMYIHGGGFVVGDPDSYDALCRHIAKTVGCAIVSVDYRLAPEHKFPAAVDDCFAVYSAIRGGEELGVDADRTRVAVGGDSAGGNLTAVVCQLARDRGVAQPSLQVLIYPMTDARGGTTSRRDLGHGYFLTKSLIDYFHGHYGGANEDPRLSPALGKFDALCPALIQTCGFDPLRDEAEVYAQHLRAAGTKVEYRCYETLIHGALAMAGYVPEARVMLAQITGALSAAL